MGRAVIRQAVASYFTNANIPFLGTVYRSRPMIVNEDDYERTMSGGAVQYASSGSAAVLVVNIPDTEREREAIVGGGMVEDKVTHRIALEVFFANTSGDPIQAQDDHDALVDAVVIAVRADPFLGTGGSPVWDSGDESPDVRVQQMEPYTSVDGTTVFIPAVIRFPVFEWAQGASGT